MPTYSGVSANSYSSQGTTISQVLNSTRNNSLKQKGAAQGQARRDTTPRGRWKYRQLLSIGNIKNLASKMKDKITGRKLASQRFAASPRA